MEIKLRLACVLIFTLLTVISCVNSLECYVCNSAKDKHCDDINLQPAVSVKGFLQNCTLPPGAYPDDEPLCRRLEFTTNMEEHRIVRSCGWIKSKSPKSCSRHDSFDLTETSCQCFADGCNGSSLIGSSVAIISFFSIAILLRNFIKC